MSSSEPKHAPGWYGPDDVPEARPQPQSSTPPGEFSGTQHHSQSSQRRKPHRTHWPPRQCRICLETVHPTTHMPSENLPGFLRAEPNITYEDESGRLIRPCMCKGSSKYVHEGCLQAWRHADPSYGRRNYWQCPTCGYQYRLARMGWSRWIASTATQIVLTMAILFVAVFLLGFVADPIINLYADPWGVLWYGEGLYYPDDKPTTWWEHFGKGFAGMGVVGFLKVILASPFSYFRFGGRRRGRGTIGRDRMEQVGWLVMAIGVFTFLWAVYQGVRAWSRRVLEKAGERVMDVRQDDDDDDE